MVLLRKVAVYQAALLLLSGSLSAAHIVFLKNGVVIITTRDKESTLLFQILILYQQ